MTTEDHAGRAGGEATAAGGGRPGADGPSRTPLDDEARREALQRSGADTRGGQPGPLGPPAGYGRPAAATGATTGAGSAAGSEARTNVLPAAERRPERPAARSGGPTRAASRPQHRPGGRGRRARLVLQRIDPWSVFLFSLVASICLGIVLLVAVATLYVVLANLGVLSSVNNVLGEVLSGTGPDDVSEPFFSAGRVLGFTAILAAVDVVLLTVLATLGALLYNLCASLTGGIEVLLGERD